MADKASIVGTNDKGQFAVSVPRSAIERVDVIDIDLVLQTKGGERLILPGAALEAMTAAPPSIRFSDGVAGAGELLSAVDKVQTPTTSIPAMTSLTEFDQKRTEGKKNLTQDGKDAAEQAAQQAQSQQVAPLPSDGRDSSIDRMIAKAESLESDMRKKAFDPAPPEVYKPPPGEAPKAGSQPPTAKIPLYLDLAEGNVVGSTVTPGVVSITGGGATRTYDNKITGTGGPNGTAVSDGIPTKDARQYATETLNGTANRDAIYADGFAGLGAYANTQAIYDTLDVNTGLPTAGNHFYYAKEVMLTMAGYIRTINSITMSGLPEGVVAVIINGTTHTVSGGSLNIPIADIVPDAKPITLIYDVATVPTGQVTISVNVNGMGVSPINVTKKFVLDFQPVDSTDDVTNTSATYIAGSGYSDIYVMETASAPHSIDAGAGDDLVYGGNSADTVVAGDGDDIVLTYAGNDIILGGLGNNTVWAGNGDDTVVGGAGNDVLRGGNGNDILYGGAGTNVLDAGAGTADWVSFNGGSTMTTASAALSDFLKYTGGDLSGVSVTLDPNGDATVTRGANTDTLFGVENVIGTTGNDVINAAAYATTHTLYGLAGDDVITGGASADTLYGGAGNDTIFGGAGNDTLYAAVTAGETSTAADVNKDLAATTVTYTGASGIGIDGLNNVLDGGAGADTLIGGLGNDYFVAAAGQSTDGTSIDTFTGVDIDADDDGVQDSIDTIDFASYTSTLVIEQAYGQAKNSGTLIASFSGIERFLLGSGNDQFTGTSASETVYGNDGDDTFTSNGGNDVFYGGASSNNTNNGDRFYTTTDSTKTNILHGGSGYNYYQLNASTNTVIGGNDVDRIDYSNTNSSVIVNLSASDSTVQFWNGTAFSGTTYTAQAGKGQLNNAANDVYRDDLAESKVDQIQGSGGADILIGNSLDNYFFPGGNTVNDVVFGRGGNDTIDMTSGSDYLDGGGAYEGAGGANGWATMTVNGVVGGDTVNANNWNSAFVATLAADGALGTIVYGSTTTTIVGIENFIAGNLADTIYGTKDANYLYAGAGNDVIWGYGGDDIINLGGNAYNNASSGADNADADGGDPLVVGAAGTNDWVTYMGLASVGVEIHLEAGQAAGWTQYSKVQVDASTAEYDNLRNFENAQGSNQADTIYGNSGVNTLWGMSGNDTLYGYDGNDVLDGGANNDTLYGGNGNDTLYGGAGNDTLYGDAGIDTMAGGTNDDTYYVDDSADTVTELVNEGVDRVYTTVSFALTDNIEILTGQGAANLTLTGNSTANTISGSTGNDIIDGGGGNDGMAGGAGNDTYYVDATGDTVTEYAGAGTDLVYTSVNYTLAANVENMTGQGTTGLTLTGNSAANIITGTSGNDIINGNGGADSLIGGDGNDSFNTTSALISTVALFQGDNGTDTVTASGWTFAANTFNNAKWSGIEAINARDNGGNDSYGMNGTDIRNIVDSGDSSALTLYLDSGDRFTVSTSDGYTCTASNAALNTGGALGAGTYTATYYTGGTTQVAQLTIVVG